MWLDLLFKFLVCNGAVFAEACVSHQVYGPVTVILTNITLEASPRIGWSLVTCADWCLQREGCHSMLWSPGRCGLVNSCPYILGTPLVGKLYIPSIPSIPGK